MNNRQNGRRRGRGGQQPRPGQSNPHSNSRVDNRQRGNAVQLLEKYKGLARDAQMQGDRVNTEYYLQFADHYFRVVSETRSRFEEQRRPRDDFQQEYGAEDDGEQPQQRAYQPRDFSDDGWDDGEQDGDGDGQPQASTPPQNQPQQRNGQPRGDRRPPNASRNERGANGAGANGQGGYAPRGGQPRQAEDAAPTRIDIELPPALTPAPVAPPSAAHVPVATPAVAEKATPEAVAPAPAPVAAVEPVQMELAAVDADDAPVAPKRRRTRKPKTTDAPSAEA